MRPPPVQEDLAVAEPADVPQPALEGDTSRRSTVAEPLRETQRRVAADLVQHPCDIADEALARADQREVVGHESHDALSLGDDRVCGHPPVLALASDRTDGGASAARGDLPNPDRPDRARSLARSQISVPVRRRTDTTVSAHVSR